MNDLLSPQRIQSFEHLARYFGERNGDLDAWRPELANGLPCEIQADALQQDFHTLRMLAQLPRPSLEGFSETEKASKLEKIALILLKEHELVPRWMSYSILALGDRIFHSSILSLAADFPAASSLEYWTTPSDRIGDRFGGWDGCTAAWAVLHDYLTQFRIIPVSEELSSAVSRIRSNIGHANSSEAHPQVRPSRVLSDNSLPPLVVPYTPYQPNAPSQGHPGGSWASGGSSHLHTTEVRREFPSDPYTASGADEDDGEGDTDQGEHSQQVTLWDYIQLTPRRNCRELESAVKGEEPAAALD